MNAKRDRLKIFGLAAGIFCLSCSLLGGQVRPAEGVSAEPAGAAADASGALPVLSGQKPRSGARAAAIGRMKMRIFEGSYETAAPPAKSVTSSFLQYKLTATVEPQDDIEAQIRSIRDVFNLKSVTLLTEADLVWNYGKVEESFQIFRIDDKSYLVVVRPTDISQRKFRITVIEQNIEKQINLLETEVGLPKNISTVFGFRDITGRPYFMSLHVLEWTGSKDEARGAPGWSLVSPSEIAALDAVRVVGNIQPPKRVFFVDPFYPEIARQARVEGIVILEVTAGSDGRVIALKVMRSIPLLDQAAMECVKQWIYEPLVIDGKARACIFSATVRFILQ